MYLKAPIYSEAELGLSGWTDKLKTVIGWTAEGAKQQLIGGGAYAPTAPAPQYEPSFLEKYGTMLLIGGGVLVVVLVLASKKKA